MAGATPCLPSRSLVRVWGDPRRSLAGRGEELELSLDEVVLLATFADAGDRVVGRHELRLKAGLARRDPRRCDSARAIEVGSGARRHRHRAGPGWRCLADVVVVQHEPA
jgi:hypothetical protein